MTNNSHSSHVDLHQLAIWSLVGLVMLRITTSLPWISGAFFGVDRKVNPEFLGGAGVTQRINGFFATHALYPGIGEWMKSFVVLHASFFGWLIFLGEFVAGLCLLLGLFTRLGGLAAALSAVMNLMAAGGAGADTIGNNYLLLILGITFIVIPAGRFLGLDALIQKRSHALIWRILG